MCVFARNSEEMGRFLTKMNSDFESRIDGQICVLLRIFYIAFLYQYILNRILCILSIIIGNFGYCKFMNNSYLYYVILFTYMHLISITIW